MRKAWFAVILGVSIIPNSISAESTPHFTEFLEYNMAALSGKNCLHTSSSDLPSIKCGTPATVALHALRSRNENMGLNTLLDRPDYLPDTLGGENILVHYTTSGVHAPYEVDVDVDPADGIPDYINRVAEVFEYVRDYQVITLEYSIPPVDFGRGGDDRYDIYVQNLGAGFYGFTNPEDLIDEHRANSYIVVENDFAGTYYSNNPVDGMKVTAAHEFFHAVQFGYDVFEYDFDDPGNPSTYKPWWMEASSVWMEDIIYDDINDYLGYLPFFYGYSWMGLGSFSYNYGDPRAFHPYASCVWPIYLTERFHTGIIREIWEGCGSIGGYNTLTATEEALQPVTSLSKSFLEFSVWNFHTGSFADTTDFFSEGHLFPEMDTTFYIHELTEEPVGIGDFPNPPEHLAANYIVIRAGQDSGGVALSFDGQDMGESEWHVAMLGYEPAQSEWIDILVEPNTGEGTGDWYNWNFYDYIVVIPTVSGISPLYEQYSYQGWVAYDSSLVGDSPVSVWPDDSKGIVPGDLMLFSSYPNPFNATTTLQYSLLRSSGVTIEIYNIIGQRVTTLFEGIQQAGNNSITWDASGFPSGIYFARLEVGNHSQSMKMVLLK